MSRWVIDDFGDVHRSGSRTFFDKLGSGLSGAETEAYAIENIGCIGLTRLRSQTLVKYRPTVVSERAISTLYYWLHDIPDGPVAISWLGDVWALERARTRTAAKAFISYTLDSAARRVLWPGPRLLAEEARDARRRWAATAPVFNRLVEMQGCTEDRRALLNRVFNGRWTLSEYDRDQNFVRILDNGPGYPPLDPVWMVDARGFSFDQFPDREFGTWVAALHKKVAATGARTSMTSTRSCGRRGSATSARATGA